MSLATTRAQRPSSKKIVLVELDIGAQQTIWFNWAAGTWYVDFDAIYDLIDGTLLAGVVAQSTGDVGSVSSDAAQLLAVSDAATVQTTELSFFYDPTTRRVYIHLQDGDEPSLHRVILGITYGVANHAGIYNGMIYEGRLLSAPSIAKSKDPLFFGRVAFDGGRIEIDNADGFFDSLGEDNDVFGNAVRILMGFDDMDYGDFARIGSGIIESIEIGAEALAVVMKDSRWSLTRQLPVNTFDQTTYPNLSDKNVGKSIPVAWGVCRNVPVICTNEDESPAPANYTFKFLDTTNHEAHALTTVRVNGVVKSTSASSLANGTFSLAAANYSPGDEVTADIEGFEDGSGNLISNALDVILDILDSYLGVEYIASAFNQAEWAAATAAAADICYFGDSPVEAISIIEEICASARVAFIVQDDGRFTARKYTPYRAVQQTFQREDLLESPAVTYDPTEVLTSTLVGYSRDWSTGDHVWLHDIANEATTYAKYKTYRERSFETLLVDAAAAQAFSDDVLLLSGAVARRTTLRMKVQPLGREVMDFVDVNLGRKAGVDRWAKAEITGITKDLVAAEIRVDCRIEEFYPDTVDQRGWYYSLNTYYGSAADGARYSLGGPQEV